MKTTDILKWLFFWPLIIPCMFFIFLILVGVFLYGGAIFVKQFVSEELK